MPTTSYADTGDEIYPVQCGFEYLFRHFRDMEPQAALKTANAVTNVQDVNHDVAMVRKRRRRDSNPRCSFPHNGFQNRHLKPLGHSSTSRWIKASSIPRSGSSPTIPAALTRPANTTTTLTPRLSAQPASRTGDSTASTGRAKAWFRAGSAHLRPGGWGDVLYMGGRLSVRQRSTSCSMFAVPAHMTLSAAPQ